MALLDDLLAMYSNLQKVSTACINGGDYADNARVVAAMTQVSNAIQVQEANDIVATLPSDQDVSKIKAVIANMSAVSAAIDQTVTSITNIVEIATGVANVVVDCSAGQFASAATAVQGLVPILGSVGISI